MTVESDGILSTFLRVVREVSGSRMASLYLGMPPDSASRPILIHAGAPPAVAELVDQPSAIRFARAAQANEGLPREAAEWLRMRPIASATEHSYLVRIPALESLFAAVPDLEPAVERRSVQPGPALPIDTSSGIADCAWLGLRFDSAESAGTDPGDTWWSPLLALAGGLAWHARWALTVANDPVSDLPGRAEFHAFLERSLGQGNEPSHLGLVFVNPDDFSIVNERFGREAGDVAIREIGQRLRQALRRTDFAFRHGAAVFGALLPLASAERLGRVAEKLIAVLGAEPYLGGSIPLNFSIGTAFHDESGGATAEEQALQLVRHADRALNAAKVSGGGRIVPWSAELDSDEVSQYDRLSGIYAANPAQDYRNMVLLWDTVGIVASHHDAETLIAQVLDKLSGTFRADTLGFVGCDDDGRPGGRLLRRSAASESVELVEEPVFDAARVELFEKARQEKRTITQHLAVPEEADGEGASLCGCVMPLEAGGRLLGYLYMEWRTDLLHLGPADLGFLDALAGQVTLALDRARLVEQEKQRQEVEREELLGELTELRDALQHSQMVYRSPSMDAVLDSVRKFAATDVTVLVSGESGTGKELLARTIHQLSPRRDRPLVVVDCGAVATSLFDSELFGHERGAYTGAERRSAGRIAEAKGGTLLLDEIGELPLEVQSKMLRFVQEKELMPVGGTRARSMDVRVIAATNRDLAAEVAAGKFREDLYHRLNVVQVVMPPLRERPEDIPLLVQHFLERFSTQYGKRVRRISAEAQEQLQRHPWHGNVRELQNRVMRAVVLCTADRIEASDLELDAAMMPAAATAPDAAASVDGEVVTHGVPDVAAVLQALSGQVDAALRDEAFPPPIGKWIGDELVLEAYRASRETASRAATLLAIPETTFRRRLEKARAGAGRASRPEGWEQVRELLAGMAEGGNPAGEDLLGQLRSSLLDEVARRLPGPGEVKRAAALLGVTEPTYRRWIAERQTGS